VTKSLTFFYAYLVMSCSHRSILPFCQG